MIDFTNKCIVTENNVESEQLLKKAIAQGFNLPKGQKAMESHRYFHFIGSPYKHVVAPYEVSSSDFNKAVRYSELFGDEQEELRKIVDSAARWCRAYGYEHLNVYANEEFESYTGKAIAKTADNIIQRVDVEIKKPRKLTVSELEAYLGYPIEIVS